MPPDGACGASRRVRRGDAHHRAAVGVEAQRGDHRQPRDALPRPPLRSPRPRTWFRSRGGRTAARQRCRLFREGLACSLDAQGPRGSSISPVGPMLPATSTCGRRGRLRRARAAGLSFSCPPIARLVQLQAIAGTAEAIGQNDVGPGLDKGALQLGDALGMIAFQSSGASPDCKPRSKRLLPVAPSASSHGPRRVTESVDRSLTEYTYLMRHGRPPEKWIRLIASSGEGFWRMMVCSRSGPVEMMSIGTPTRDCSRSR